MAPPQIASALVALVALATVLGLLWRWQNGRSRTTNGLDRISAVEIGSPLGRTATLVQFSSEICAPCRSTHTVLASLAAGSDDVEHVDVDVATNESLTRRFNVLQTPTTLVLDGDGVVRARIGGAARPHDVRAHLAVLSTARLSKEKS